MADIFILTSKMSPNGQPRRNTPFALKSVIKWKERRVLSFAFSLFYKFLLYEENVSKSLLAQIIIVQGCEFSSWQWPAGQLLEINGLLTKEATEPQHEKITYWSHQQIREKEDLLDTTSHQHFIKKFIYIVYVTLPDSLMRWVSLLSFY